jgi:hypothetical protein
MCKFIDYIFTMYICNIIYKKKKNNTLPFIIKEVYEVNFFQYT